MIRKLLILFVVLNCVVLSGQNTFPIDTLQYNGDNEKLINLVFLPDGYQQVELDQFVIDAQEAADVLFSYSPYKECRIYFNVYAIRVPSVDSGLNHPGNAADEATYPFLDPNQPVHATPINTAFKLTYDAFQVAHRLIASTDLTLVSDVLMDNFPLYDQAMIIGNAPYYGGSGGEFPTMSTHPQGILVGVHELGHSFVDLKDEYWAGAFYAAEAYNMTQETDPNQARWKNWIGDNSIDLHPYYSPNFEPQIAASWYKSANSNCMMERLDKTFCSVCTEATVEKIHELVNPILSSVPDHENLITASTSSLAFNANVLEPNPNTITKKWLLNGVEIAAGVNGVTLTEAQLATGMNTLTLSVEDDGPFLRVDNHDTVHTNSVTWNIDCDTCSDELPNTVKWKETFLCDYDENQVLSAVGGGRGSFESASIGTTGWVELEITSDNLHRTYMGLGKTDAAGFSFYMQVYNNTYLFLHNGAGSQTRMEDVTVGDVIRMELTATQILFKKNGLTFATKTRTLAPEELGTYRIQGVLDNNTKYKIRTSFTDTEDWDPYVDATTVTNTWKHLNATKVEGDNLVVQSEPSYIGGTATSANYGQTGKAEIQIPNFEGSVVFGITKEEFVDHTSDFLSSIIFRSNGYISFMGNTYHFIGGTFDADDTFAIQYDATTLYFLKNGVSIFSRPRNSNEQGDLRIGVRASRNTVMVHKTTFTDVETFHEAGIPEQVTWHSIGGINFDNLPNLVVNGPSGYHIGRATSKNTLLAGEDGWAEVVVKDLGLMRFGLYSTTTNNNHVFTLASGSAQPQIGSFYEIPQIEYTIGDVMRVERKNNRIYFKKNGAYVFVLDNTIADDAQFQVHMNNNGMELDTYTTSFTNLITDPTYQTTPIVWDTTLSNGSQATSQRLIGDGHIEFKVGNTSATVWLTPDNNLTYPLYGAYHFGATMFANAPNLKNSYVNVSNVDDIYRIERVGSTVYFKKNGYIIGSGSVDASLDLMPWGSNSITDATISTNLISSRTADASNGFILPDEIVQNSKISITPNPSSAVCTINSNEFMTQYDVYDVTGLLIKSQALKNVKQVKVRVSDLRSGVYFIKVYSDTNEVTTKKLIKK